MSLAGREGFTIETKKGDVVFKPYLLVQTSAKFNWYDDEGLDKAYNQDNIANSGFSIPYAVLGGIRRGLYSNEAGIGSAPNASASANVSHPVKQGLVPMLSVFIDTLLLCTATRCV